MTEGPDEAASAALLTRQRETWLLAATFVVAVAGLIYELVAATLSSYLLGDSVRQFSLVIGIYLASMGLGAWLSRFVGQALPGFIWAQIALGVIGGFMAPLLYFTYAATGDVELPLFAALIAVGALSGMEIPLIARILKQIGAPEFRFENVLTVDYAGALAASLLFPTLILPHLGLMSASLAFGMMNLLVAGMSLWIFRDLAPRLAVLVWGLAVLATGLALWQAERMVSVAEAALYDDDIILAEQTPFQRIVVTRFRERVRLFLDGSIQFDSIDEYRYHEMLVHPAMALAGRAERVLILGGGDGMALREVLRHSQVQAVTLVDLDPAMTTLFREDPDLAALNAGALSDPRVTIVNRDAWKFVEEDQGLFDVILADLPDPKSIALSKLYTREFYAMAMERLSPRGAMAVQAGSPLFARDAYWSVIRTLRETRNPSAPEAGLHLQPYHAYLPSFGDWGFALVTQQPHTNNLTDLPPGLRYLTPEIWAEAQVFAPDAADSRPRPNSLRDHALVGYYNDGWDRWFR
ncbi:polyamine aminopropyltransferase [Neogemmobacter tilapiae]|uniref:Polyamine aminopropyltransferase n=1 Tax=Neogemmobacter tilapiae TaxID=875041 RepID=A0A918WQ21_9RHOB|nr:polyamine aminopropyltransferase [Gemmobacter tilapiae]GHC65339.1 polyamine aminopropyltransferase [Gemmobacter tilapiae]